MSTSTGPEPGVYLLRCVTTGTDGISPEDSYATAQAANEPVVVAPKSTIVGKQLWFVDKPAGNTAGVETWAILGLGGDGGWNGDLGAAKLSATAALSGNQGSNGVVFLPLGFKFEGIKIESGTVITLDTTFSSFTIKRRGDNLYSITPFKEDDFFHIGIEYYLGISDNGKSEVVIKEVSVESPPNLNAIPLWELKVPEE